MRHSLPATALPLAILAVLAAPHAVAQDSTAAPADAAPADAPPAETPAAAETAPPVPEFNGTASGSVSGAALDTRVVCEGFGSGGPVTVQSDPGPAPSEDGNGDGTVVDIRADPSGLIALTLFVAGSRMTLDDTTAEVRGDGLSYDLTMSFVGGGEERVELTVACD